MRYEDYREHLGDVCDELEAEYDCDTYDEYDAYETCAVYGDCDAYGEYDGYEEYDEYNEYDVYAVYVGCDEYGEYDDYEDDDEEEREARIAEAREEERRYEDETNYYDGLLRQILILSGFLMGIACGICLLSELLNIILR